MDAATNDPENVPEVDDCDSDEKLSFDKNAVSSTKSVSSSILNYRIENGRSYHAFRDGSYLYPNDERENDRLDHQHHIWLLCLDGKLGLAPPLTGAAPPPKRVLDVGTGTGIWAIDTAEEFPDSHVIGNDLSPIQPNFVPPNVEFFVDDIEDTWEFNDYKFDYIHSRFLNSSIKDWAEYFKKCYDNLQPGGFLEIQEFGLCTADDGTMENTALQQCMDIMQQGAAANGRPFIHPWSSKIRKWLEAAGFINITGKRFYWPCNTWPRDQKLKELGMWSNYNLQIGLEAFIMASATRLLGWSKEEVLVLAAKAKADVNNRNIHAFWPVGIVVCQKPKYSKHAQY